MAWLRVWSGLGVHCLHPRAPWPSWPRDKIFFLFLFLWCSLFPCGSFGVRTHWGGARGRTQLCTHSHGVFVFPLLLLRSQEGNLIDEATKGKVDAFLEAFVHAIKVSKAGEAALKASA
jgi:hypothetical protein